MGGLLASDVVTMDEKKAILEYLGAADNLEEQTLSRASEFAENQGAVFQALADILQRHTNPPEDIIPQQPVSEPQSPAGSGGDAGGNSVVDQVLSSMIGS